MARGIVEVALGDGHLVQVAGVHDPLITAVERVDACDGGVDPAAGHVADGLRGDGPPDLGRVGAEGVGRVLRLKVEERLALESPHRDRPHLRRRTLG